MQIIVKGEILYGMPENYVYQDNLGKLENPEQVERVLKFRAGEELFKKYRVIPQMEIDELKRTIKRTDLITKILDLQGAEGVERQKRFKRLLDNVKKENLCEMYLRETSYKSA